MQARLARFKSDPVMLTRACCMQIPDEIKRLAHRSLDTFFLPMHDPDIDHTNPTLPEYMHWNLLEEAPVSFAARHFVLDLQARGLEPRHWRDRHSRPLLESAVRWNYISLVKWLVCLGCDIRSDGDRLLRHAKAANFNKLAAYIRSQL
jgi:hypothetical protein